MHSKMFDVVSEYEAALDADHAAGSAWKAARDAAERELIRAHPEHDGGHFAFNDDDGADDRLRWVAADVEWPGVVIEDAPFDVRQVARVYGVAEALVNERRTTARRAIATDLVLHTPCADARDTLEKFRALGLAEGFLVASSVYQEAMTLIETIVADCVSEAAPDAAARSLLENEHRPA